MIKLSTLTVSLGLAFSAAQILGLVSPAKFSRVARGFCRSIAWGYLMMAIGTAWFLYNVKTESLSDFANYQKYMLWGFGGVGLLTCLYVQDYLAVRGLAIVLLLLAKLTLDVARWHPSEWRLVMAAWAYLWIVAAIWFTVSPWRLRDLIVLATATPRRIRIGSLLRLLFGLFVVALGLTRF